MFNSLAARSSSSSMPDARSTFTLRIGPGIIMRPVLVKNRDTSLPWSARRAMASAGIGFRGLRVLFIKLLEPSFSGPLDVGHHGLPQDAVHPCLISFAALFQPGDHIGIEPHRDGLLHGTIEPSPNRVFPSFGRKLRDIRSIDLVNRQRDESHQLSFLFRGEASSRYSLHFPVFSCFAHMCSVRGVLPFVPTEGGFPTVGGRST